MSVTEHTETFALEAMSQPDASVGREDGVLVVSRPLTDGVTEVEDVLELVAEHPPLTVANVQADTDSQELRVWIREGSA